MTTAPAPASPVAEFVHLGYRGASLHFRVRTGDLETFRACVHAIGAYNEFSVARSPGVPSLSHDVAPDAQRSAFATHHRGRGARCRC
jgi:hypothetical protein